MKIISFTQANVSLPQLGNAPAMLFQEGNVKCLITAWKPSREDLIELNKGNPIFLQVYKDMPPTMMYTVNEKGEPNV